MRTKVLTATMILAATLATPTALAGHGYHSAKYRGATVHRSFSTGHYAYRPVRRASSEYDYAQVVHVEPIVRIVRSEVPVRECWEEEVWRETRRRGDGVAGATIAGGLIGGVIGRQFGDGNGRDAMTVVGSIVGSAIANEAARDARYRDGYADGYYDTVRRCETRYEVREKERVDGYRVTYLYNGKEYTTRTDSDPGDRIRVRVSVSPLTRS